MKKRIFVAMAMAAIMAATTACGGSMPGMGNSGSTSTTAAAAGSESKAADAGASDGKTYELKISTSQTEQAAITRSYQKLADTLNEKSNGRLKVTVFPAGQLGSDEDVLEQAIQGVNVAVNTDASRCGQYVKDMSILMMPYMFDNYDECAKVTETDTFKSWTDDLDKNHGIKVLSFTFYDGPRHFMTNKVINSPEDLKGLRIRTIGQEVTTKAVEAMGATPVSMSWGEVYNGIQSKALDGCEVQNTSALPSRIYEVCKNQAKTGHFQLMQGLLVGSQWFNTLPADLQELLTTTAQDVGKETAEGVEAECETDEQEMVKNGLQVNTPDLQPFKDAVAGEYDALGYTDLRAQLYKEIGKQLK
jgi:TRAP-type C4-dicarboxylate transport system substrate-binding protein